MRRVLLAVFGIVAVTVLLVSVKSAPGASRTPEQITATSTPTRRPTHTESATPAPPKPDPVPTAKPTRTVPPPPAAPKGVLGDSVLTQYGYVQVKIVVAGGRLTDVVAVELPSREPRSVRIGERAAPILRQEALTAQDADIDTVSGATYTSEGYRESLQSALDKLS